MHVPLLLTTLLGVASVAAVENPHKRAPIKRRAPTPNIHRANSNHGKRSHLTDKTQKYAVDGNGLPDVNFDIGESYAGTLSIDDNPDNENQLYFWFFPSDNAAASNEIVLWLNGGPGCSSMDGLFQENGPFLWQSGTYRPIANPYSWVNLTNMVWVDQPVGTGFSPNAKGAVKKLKTEKDVAVDFMGFWKNFMETFDLTGRSVYLTGESYAGQYIPYISYHMLEANDTDYYNVKGIQVNDPSINEGGVMTNAPAVGFVNANENIFGLNQTTMDFLNKQNDECGFTDFMDNALSYPPKGPISSAPSESGKCGLWNYAVSAAVYINPCFNIYHVIDYCPYLWDELGFPSFGWGPNDYFNRSDVQKAINAPPTNYLICGEHNYDLGASIPSALGPLPTVIEKTNNVLIGGGALDFLLLSNGSLVTIQNMTWNGKQGFQEKPCNDFYVPYHPGLAEIVHDIFYQPIPGPVETNVAGSGYLGTWHTERGLTWCDVNHSGHEIPQYVPGASYRHLEFLLGRISNLGEVSDFTTQHGDYDSGKFPGNPY